MSDRACFLSVRNDGIGERLRALINAIALARHFDAPFRFHWPSRSGDWSHIHAIRPAREIFSRDFCDRFLIEDISSLRLVELTTGYDEALVRAHIDCGTFDGVVVHQTTLSAAAPDLKRALASAAVIAAFESIGFSDTIAAAMDAARKTPLAPDAVAIHFRAGDIVYGPLRTQDRFTQKVFPFALGFHVIRQLRADGVQTVIFSQDDDLASYAVRKLGAVSSAEMAARFDFSLEEAAFYDIALMARCLAIYGGSSGFSSVAAMIGGRRKDVVTRLFSPGKAADVTLATEEMHVECGISPLQKAFSAWFPLHLGEADLPEDSVSALLALARRYDPVNPLYLLVSGARAYRAGRIDEGDLMMSIAFAIKDDNGRPGRAMRSLIGARSLTGQRLFDRHRAAIRAAAEQGSTVAPVVLAMDCLAGGDKARAAVLLKGLPPNDRNEDGARYARYLLRR